MARSTSVARERFAPNVYWLDQHTIAIDWRGYVTGETCYEALHRFRELCIEHKPSRFFSDTSEATGYDVKIHQEASDILKAVRDEGIKDFVAVIDSQAIRMFASTLAFVTGLRLAAFGSRSAALEHLGSLPLR